MEPIAPPTMFMDSPPALPGRQTELEKHLNRPGSARTIASVLCQERRFAARSSYRQHVKYCINNDLPLPPPWCDPDFQHPPCHVTFRDTRSHENDWFHTILVDNPVTTTVGDLNQMLKNTPPLTVKHCIPGRPERSLYPDERTVRLDHTQSTMRASALSELGDGREIKLWQTQYGSRYVDPEAKIADISYLWEDPTKIHLILEARPYTE